MADYTDIIPGAEVLQGGTVYNDDIHSDNDSTKVNVVPDVESGHPHSQIQCKDCDLSVGLIHQLQTKIYSMFANFQLFEPRLQDEDTDSEVKLGDCDSSERFQHILPKLQQAKEGFDEEERDYDVISPERNTTAASDEYGDYFTSSASIDSLSVLPLTYGLLTGQHATKDVEGISDRSVVLTDVVEFIFQDLLDMRDNKELAPDISSTRISSNVCTSDLPIFDADNTAQEKLLLLAAARGNMWAAHMAFKAGANVNVKDGAGETALHWASRVGHVRMTKFLLERQADIDAKNELGATALIWAAWARSTEVAKILLAHDARINESDLKGSTPLHWAAKSGFEPMVRLLLDKGADPNAKDTYLKTPRGRAITERQKFERLEGELGIEELKEKRAEYRERMRNLSVVARLLERSSSKHVSHRALL